MPIPHYDWLAYHASRTPDKTAWVDLASGREFSYFDANSRCSRLAGYLQQSLDIKKGDRVAVLAMNSTDIFEVQYACAKIGAIFLPLNWRLTLPELEFIVGDAEPSLLIYDREFANLAVALKEKGFVSGLLETAGLGGDSAYEAALASSGESYQSVSLTHDDAWTIMYTSGTTGRPKGAINTYGMAFYNAANMAFDAGFNCDTISLTVLPLFHTGGLNLYASVVLYAGGSTLVMRSFDALECLWLLTDTSRKITHFFGIPTHYLFMSQQPEFAEADFSSLICTGIGGAPTPLTLLEAYHKKGTVLRQGFGMTETGPAVLTQDADMALNKVGSSGKPVLNTQVRIVDEEGCDVKQGEVGELWIKGPNITPGYWNRPEANAQDFNDGWFHTGDAARMDEEGHYYIVDRWKDMYISGGENVYPAEVENVLFAMDAIAEVAVIGVPDDKWGEVGCAVIVKAPGSTLKEQDVISFCKGQLVKYKIPKDVVFVDELPRNATGKVLKRVLKMQLFQ